MKPMASNDPVLARRARAQRIVAVGQRVGYALYGLAVVVFLVGVATTFSSWVSTVVVVGLVGGSIVLAPAIIGGYAIKAAVRDDIEHGRDLG